MLLGHWGRDHWFEMSLKLQSDDAVIYRSCNTITKIGIDYVLYRIWLFIKLVLLGVTVKLKIELNLIIMQVQQWIYVIIIFGDCLLRTSGENHEEAVQCLWRQGSQTVEQIHE